MVASYMNEMLWIGVLISGGAFLVIQSLDLDVTQVEMK